MKKEVRREADGSINEKNNENEERSRKPPLPPPPPVKEPPELSETRIFKEDPVVGWLVVVEGPGKGRAMQLGYGMNAIGRGATDRVKLDFGDDQISRGEHAVVTYDPRGRKFYVQHGGGTNLTYLGDDPVLTPVELPALSHIAIGNTVLRFVPLCGDGFDWQDLRESATK